ncbi:hypothetical protein GS4_17_00570 [Gordonia soli NBRC 108243]|uniref:Branched-chain amino acid transporter n=2 Tax=Gordonia soli TaxID=320799 RepID=M0QK56_9ACTN|nr:hypothetical protein GS4_17_00570 [Gordonia soli NBRC 108243]
MASLLLGIGVLAVGTYAIRVAGPAMRSRVTVGPRTQRLLDRAAIVLLVAVALTGALYVGHDFAGWARPIGVGAGLLAAVLKAPIVVVVVLAAAVTAGLRAAGVA